MALPDGPADATAAAAGETTPIGGRWSCANRLVVWAAVPVARLDVAPARESDAGWESTRTNGFRDALAARSDGPGPTVPRAWSEGPATGVCGACDAGGVGAADVCGVACAADAFGVTVAAVFGGAGAHPQFQFHVHTPPANIDWAGADVPVAQSVALQFQFQIHVAGRTPGPVGTTETPVGVGADVPWVGAVADPPAAVLVCVTVPSSPGLLTRTTTFRFVGAAWPAVAAASDTAVCATVWTVSAA